MYWQKENKLELNITFSKILLKGGPGGCDQTLAVAYSSRSKIMWYTENTVPMGTLVVEK